MTNANVKNILPIDMEFCFAIWISFVRLSSNGKHFFFTSNGKMFSHLHLPSAVCHNKRNSFRTYYTNKVSQSLTDGDIFCLKSAPYTRGISHHCNTFYFQKSCRWKFQHVQKVPHLRGFHYRRFHYRDFWLMYAQVGYFCVSRGPHQAW